MRMASQTINLVQQMTKCHSVQVCELYLISAQSRLTGFTIDIVHITRGATTDTWIAYSNHHLACDKYKVHEHDLSHTFWTTSLLYNITGKLTSGRSKGSSNFLPNGTLDVHLEVKRKSHHVLHLLHLGLEALHLSTQVQVGLKNIQWNAVDRT